MWFCCPDVAHYLGIFICHCYYIAANCVSSLYRDFPPFQFAERVRVNFRRLESKFLAYFKRSSVAGVSRAFLTCLPQIGVFVVLGGHTRQRRESCVTDALLYPWLYGGRGGTVSRFVFSPSFGVALQHTRELVLRV